MDEQQVLQNEDPEIIGTVFNTAIGILQLYGWFILFAVIILLYISSKVKPWLGQLSHQRDMNSYKKLDAGTAQERLEAMERSRLKMQAELDEKAKKFAKRQKEKEEEKRRQRVEGLEKLSQGKGNSRKTKAPAASASSTAAKSKPKKTLKPDYKPLMGESSSGACYRPSRRGGGGGRSGGG